MTLVLALAACGDTTPRARLNQEQELQIAELRARYLRDLAGPTYAGLAEEIDLKEEYRRKLDPCARIREDRVPTAEERIALKQWARLRETFFARYQDLTLREPPGSSQIKGLTDQLNAAMDNGLRAQSVLIANLAEGHLTYCQFATQDKLLTEGVLHEAIALRRDISATEDEEFSLSHRIIEGSAPLR
jgi:hypothetical protein